MLITQRKCGRVVCNSCSPHRITIPYQYIVQPPGAPRVSAQRYSTVTSVDGGYTDFSSLGGGERVRLCNPCVPDPNTTPPQTQDSTASRTHLRTQSSIGGAFGGDTSRRYGTYFPPMPAGESLIRSRSVTLVSARPLNTLYLSSHIMSDTEQHGNAAAPLARAGNGPQSRIMVGTPPTYFPGSTSTHQPAGGASSSSSGALPAASAQPRPQIAEEDECPVCHRELPPRTLPNYEAVREAHITICITTHSRYAGGGSSMDADAQPRRTGMFPYRATEKDCIDSAECTICLEEFAVGVPMARLECLCRFHHSCIAAWFVGHPGRCPVHQHDSFGY